MLDNTYNHERQTTTYSRTVYVWSECVWIYKIFVYCGFIIIMFGFLCLMSSWCVLASRLLPLAIHALPFAHLCRSFLLTHTVVVLLSWAQGGILKDIPVYSSFWLFIVVIGVFKTGQIPFFIFSRWQLCNWIVLIILWHLRLLIGVKAILFFAAILELKLLIYTK